MTKPVCFTLFDNQDPQQCPRVVRNLSESYNPHVRYGAALAAGIACAGSASPSAISLVEPLLKDGSAFVRQGASMAMAMLYMQANEKSSPKVVKVELSKFHEKIFFCECGCECISSRFFFCLCVRLFNSGST